MTFRVAFQMEPMEATNPAETHTLALMREAQDRGFEVWHFTPRDVLLRGEQVIATARRVALYLERTPHFTHGAPETLDLRTLDVILIRREPPFNME